MTKMPKADLTGWTCVVDEGTNRIIIINPAGLAIMAVEDLLESLAEMVIVFRPVYDHARGGLDAVDIGRALVSAIDPGLLVASKYVAIGPSPTEGGGLEWTIHNTDEEPGSGNDTHLTSDHVDQTVVDQIVEAFNAGLPHTAAVILERSVR